MAQQELSFAKSVFDDGGKRAMLLQKIANCQKKQDDAANARDFQKAMDLDKEIKDIENQIEALAKAVKEDSKHKDYPWRGQSSIELEETKKNLDDKLADLIKLSKWEQCASSNTELSEIQKYIEETKGSELKQEKEKEIEKEKEKERQIAAKNAKDADDDKGSDGGDNDEKEDGVAIEIFQDLDSFKAQTVVRSYGTKLYRYCVVHADKGDYYITCSDDHMMLTFDLEKKDGKFIVKMKKKADLSLKLFIDGRNLRVLVPLTTSDFKTLAGYSFFVGDMGRNESTDILRVHRNSKSQCYLVRVSENAKGLVLSVTFDDPNEVRQSMKWKLRHYPIEKTPFGFRMPQQSKHYATLEDLIESTFRNSHVFNDEDFQPYARPMETTLQVGEYYNGYVTLEEDIAGGMTEYANMD